MSMSNNINRGSNVISHAQSATHQTIINNEQQMNFLAHPIMNNNRPNSSNMPYSGSHQQVLEANLNHSKSNAANMQLFKNTAAGKPPKAINQSMQHVQKGPTLISQDLLYQGNGGHGNTTNLDLSVDSISNRPATALLKNQLNIDSCTTLKTASAKHNQRPQMMLQVLHQEMGPGNSHKQTPAQGGSSVVEGAIKGRKIDNPHLVVVKELKEQEDFDESMRANNIKNGQIPRRSRMQEDLLNLSLLNNSGFVGIQKSIQNPDRQRNSKSQEHKPRRNKSKDRTAAANIIPAIVKDPKVNDDLNKKSLQQVKPLKSGTKSSRENVQATSLGLNELLIIDQQPGFHHHQQAQNQGQADFKNRTHHEILKKVSNDVDLRSHKSKKLVKELDTRSKNENKEQSRSRSRDKKSVQQSIKVLAQNQISAILPKSLVSKDKSAQNQAETRKACLTSHAHTDASADKKTSQFIQHQDLGGRCVTSQGLGHQSQLNLVSLNSNGGRTFSQPNLAKSTSKSSRYTLHTDPIANDPTRQQSSPDRSIISNSNNHQLSRVANIGIDKLVKQNLIKMRSKMEEEKIQRQVSEERLRKKKELLDQSNQLVRKANKDKIYKQSNHHQQLNAIGNQQSQDYVLSTSNPSTIDYPGANPKVAPRKFELKHLKQQLNIQKLSQSQKIDFALIKESSKNNKNPQNFNGNKIANHRKSYGLEFIDIKKEIQDELKTIEQRHNLYHFKDSAEVVASQDSSEPVISSAQFDFNHPPPKRLKIKQASRQFEHIVQDSEMLDHQHNLTQSSFLDTSIAGCQGHQNNKTERGGSDEQQPSLILDSDHQHHNVVPRLNLNYGESGQPHQKILIVKKSKIRKFMKMKKREKQKEQIEQQNNEILKTIKMQENITRLNEFCKKNLQKNFQKKRNATIQQQPYENIKTTGVNNTKISGRKIDFDEANDSQQKNDESSRLSTEFYEEYYNAIKALKNPGQSRQQIAPPVGGTTIKLKSSPTNKSVIIKSNGAQNQTLALSPKEDKQNDESKSKIHIPKPSKSSLSSTTGNHQVLKQKFKKPKTSKSRHPPGIFQNQNLLPISQTQQNIISNFIAKKKQRLNGSQDRSESAPLYKKKNSSQTRLNQSNLNDSMKHSSHGKNFKLNSSSQKQSKGLLEIELELMHIYLTKQATKIQRAYRRYLQKRGFYDQDASTVQRQAVIPSSSQRSQFVIQTTEDQETTVRRDEIPDDARNHRTLDYLITDGELAECPDTTLKPPPYSQLEKQHDEELEYDDEEEDEESEGENNPQLIIINQDQLMDDEKKVVYLSNINSCSLPQTPKLDDDEKTVKQPSIQHTFDYIAHKNGFILEQINDRRGDVQVQVNKNNISQSSSVDAAEFDEDQQSVIQHRPQDQQIHDDDAYSSQEEEHKSMSIEELQQTQDKDYLHQQQVQDYGMRMLTGSQSLLREIKMASTPRDQMNVSSAFKDMVSLQRSVTQSANKRNLTSQNSEQSLQTIQVVLASGKNAEQQHQTNTTSSHQSIFDRNSFQNFTAQKLQDMIRNNEFLNLISMRERALDYRQEKERKYIKKLYKARQMSPRTYTEKKEQLERWVRIEQEDIQRTKVQYQQEWDKAVKMIEETQKNVMQIKEQIFNNDISEHFHSKQGGLLSSRNSSASQLYNTQHSCQKNSIERKSFLEQEDYQPIVSHRLLTQSNQKSIKRPNYQNSIDDSNQQELTKPSLFKSNLTTLDMKKAENGGQPVTNDGTTLMDFLEESWKKTQVSTSKQTILENQNRIFIQDQNNMVPEINDQEQSNSHPISPDKTSEGESHFEGENVLKEESKTLMRSRPEQDLTELIKKSKPENNDNNNDCQGLHLLDADESFRLLESDRLQQNQNSQVHILQKTANGIHNTNDDIRIQENLFDDSSQRQLSVGHQDHVISGSQLERELPSQEDSLLNEQELNQYFNDEGKYSGIRGPIMKFSIEDFKQLDKRKLLLGKIGPLEGSGVNESARSQFDLYDNDEDELISKNQDDGASYVLSARDTELKQEDGIMAEEKQITLESNQSLSMQDNESNNNMLIQKNHCINIQQTLPQKDAMTSSEPELITLPQTSSFLFQNAKPGENIKISDILKQNSKHQHFLQSLQVQNSSPINSIENEKEQIVFEIAEDILRMLIDEQVQIPDDIMMRSASSGLATFNPKNLEASPEYSLIVPQRINGDGGDPTIPMFTFDALEVDEINLEQKQSLTLLNIDVPIQQNNNTPLQNAQNQDVFFVDNSFNEKEQRRELIDLRQRMLIESDLSRIEAYINEVINTLQQHELNFLEGMAGQPQLLAEPNFHRQFLQVLTVPIKRSQLDVLNHLQTSEIGSYEHFETAMDIASHPILPVDLYLEIERQREEQHLRILSSTQQQDASMENSVIQESVHIHNKGIFDALNESLMKFRPYGIQGEPMPWSNKVRRLQTKVDTSQVDTERLFFMVKQDVMRWASNCVGCLPSQVFLTRRGLPEQTNNAFDDEIFQETRERRLAQMLASEVVETEHQWLNYEFEEAQIKIDLSDMILELLVEETVQCLLPSQ